MPEIIFVISLCLIGLFLLSIKLKDNSIIDAFWGLGFVIIALVSYFLYSDFTLTQSVLTLLVSSWGVRLFFVFLGKKLPYAGKEDPRYARWRKQWKYFYTRSFFQVYVLQGILMFLVATPILLVNMSENITEDITLTLIGGLVALMGLLYEDRADGELYGFIQNKKNGEILTAGLRKFHRYPQYFGESIFWLGISIISLEVSIFGLIGWGVITILVRFVSGVPLLEERYAGQENYEAYSAKTSLFIPDYSKIEIFKNKSSTGNTG